MRQKFQRNEDLDTGELSRIAVELYAKDQEKLEEEEATKSALSEMSVPPEYLDRAREMLETERAIRARATTRSRLMIAILLPVLITIALLVSRSILRAMQPPPPTYTIGFDKLPWTEWAVDLNPTSEGKADILKDKDSTSFARITVNKFGYTRQQFWLNFIAHKGPYDFARHHSVTFRARSNGMPALRLRMLAHNEEWMSPVLSLTKDWQVYTVNLDRLDHSRHNIGMYYTYLGPNTRVDDSIDTVTIDLGAFVNPIGAHGTVDISPLTVN